MQHSKLQTFLTLQSMIPIQDQLPHQNCQCLHCKNNTTPLQKGRAPRIISPKEKTMNNTKAYEFLVKQLTKSYGGQCQVPDIFLISDSSLVYQSRNQGRPRIKEHQTNMDAKKHFEEQRKRVNGPSQLYVSSIFMIPEEGGSQVIRQKSHKQKEAAILTYSDGTEQLLTDVLLSKILDRRKNDSSWDSISHIILIPPQIKHPFVKVKHHYIRSSDSVPQLNTYISKISMQMDGLQEKAFVSAKQEKLAFLPLDQEQSVMESSSITNPEQNSLMIAARKSRSMIIPKKTSKMFTYSEVNEEYVKKNCLELVAYLEVNNLMRILQADFQFFNDGTKIYLSNIYNFIYEVLEGLELTGVHDRYKPLEEISLKEISLMKEELDEKQAEQLLNICGATVRECLEFRKVELKLQSYNSPSREGLLKIFMSIFPNFKVDDIFRSKNWKNELGAFIENAKTQINRIIREDEGIRILRRHGIQFRRTFH